MGNNDAVSHLSAEITPRDETRSCGPLLRVRLDLYQHYEGHRVIAMNETDLCFTPATELVDAVRAQLRKEAGDRLRDVYLVGDIEKDTARACIERLRAAARLGASLGLEVHAGHGLNYRNVHAVAALREIVELNIGHALIAHALFVGLPAAVREMKALMAAARA